MAWLCSKRAANALIKKSELTWVERTKKYKEIPKLTLVKVIKKNSMSIKAVIKNMVLNRIEYNREKEYK